MFVGKARTYPIEAPFRCSTLRLAPGLALKQKPRLERLARGKHSSLLRKYVNYGRKKFYNIGPWSLQETTRTVRCWSIQRKKFLSWWRSRMRSFFQQKFPTKNSLKNNKKQQFWKWTRLRRALKPLSLCLKFVQNFDGWKLIWFDQNFIFKQTRDNVDNLYFFFFVTNFPQKLSYSNSENESCIGNSCDNLFLSEICSKFGWSLIMSLLMRVRQLHWRILRTKGLDFSSRICLILFLVQLRNRQ